MSEPIANSVIHCINPDCQRPIIRSLSTTTCPTCKTILRLNDRYIPLTQLASNRYTATYLAYDLKAKTEAILKVLIETTPKAVEFFHHTARVLSSMRCPGLPRVPVKSYFTVPLRGSVHSLPCFVMERVTGKPFQQMIDQYPKGCPQGWVVQWLGQIIDTIVFLHGRQLVHGNLTPDNILLREDTDQPILIGFGNPRYLMGIPTTSIADPRSHAYKPVAQAGDADLNESADLFAIGRICIQLLTGAHPADLEDQRTGKLRWRNRARVSSEIAQLLDKLTDPNPAHRPKTAIEVKAALAELAPKTPKTNEKRQPTQNQRSTQVKQRTHTAAKVEMVAQSCQFTAHQGSEIATTIGTIIQGMIGVTFTTAIATLAGFWLTFYSPFSPTIQQFFTTLPPLPIVLNPVMLIFMLAGMGTSWGILSSPKSNHSLHFWTTVLLGSCGYGLSWMSWQWIPHESATVAIARIAAIAGLFTVIQLCLNRYVLIHLLVTVIGLSCTMTILLRSSIMSADILYGLYPVKLSTNWIPDQPLTITSLVFFISLGVATYFWASMSQEVILPLLVKLFRKCG